MAKLLGGTRIYGTATVDSTLNVGGQLVSTITTGTAPFSVASTTPVANLNATTATNIGIGTVNQVPYQTATGITGFSSSLTYTPGSNTFSVGNITGSLLSLTLKPKVPVGAEASGGLDILTNNAVATNGAGGTINVTSGAGLGTGAGGDLVFTSGGSGSELGSTITLTGASTGQGGAFFMSSGYAGSGSGIGGDLTAALGGGIADDGNIYFQDAAGNNFIQFKTASPAGALQMGFYNTAPISKPTVTGDCGGNVALQNFLSAQDSLGLITDSTSPGTAAGGGDMLKSAYDSNDDGVVNEAVLAQTAPWAGLTGVPSTFAPSTHNHIISDVTGLQTALDGKEAAGTAATAVTTHEGLIDPHPQYTTLTEIAAVTRDIHGFIDRTSTTLSFNEGTRTFSITPVASTWSVYILGSLKTITGALSIVIPNTTGNVFVRVNSAGTALETVSGIPDFANDVYAVYIYWNAITSKALIVGDERHGSARDTTWHSNQHLNVGTVWRSGGAVSYTLNAPTTINIGLAAPIRIADEDLLHIINHAATPTVDYEQVLDTSAVLEVLYLDGTVYTTTTPSTSPWIAGTSTARYNQVTTGSGSLVDAGEGKYITYWLLATNDIRRPIKLVLGRLAHDTVDAAYSETFTDYGISFSEQVFMHQIVIQTSTSYSNSAKVVIAAVRKITEKLASSGVTYSAGAHSELTGRESSDQHTIGAITGLQAALDAKQDDLVSGTTIKTINSITLLGSGNLVVPSAQTFTFGGTGTPTTGTDKTPYLRVTSAQVSASLSLVTKVAPTGNFTVSVLRSANNGSTFPDTIATVTVSSGNKVASTTATLALAIGDILRLDISAVNGATDWTAQLYTTGA